MLLPMHESILKRSSDGRTIFMAIIFRERERYALAIPSRKSGQLALDLGVPMGIGQGIRALMSWALGALVPVYSIE